mmetsp:Transcript_72744/g.115488  ORF Transcript_72744/g.115488 Transcript_72744/m.115488 type:complete len:235 (-) Transcript_72744:1134-1838(-)
MAAVLVLIASMKVLPAVVLNVVVAAGEIQIQLGFNLRLCCGGIRKKFCSQVLRRNGARSPSGMSVDSHSLSVGMDISILVSPRSGFRPIVVTLHMPLIAWVLMTRFVHQQHDRFNAFGLVRKGSCQANTAGQMQDVDEICHASRNKHLGIKPNANGIIDKEHDQNKQKARPNHDFKDQRGEVAGTMLFAGIPLPESSVLCSKVSINVSRCTTPKDGDHSFVDQCINWHLFATQM